MPLEMHAIHFKTSYLNQAEALKHPDGVICIAYLFQVNIVTTQVDLFF